MTIRTIAIDGPAGCGKSTLGKKLAERLDFFFLDTGLLYRAIARHAMNTGVKFNDEDHIIGYAAHIHVEIKQIRPKFKFELNAATVTDLYNKQIDMVVPTIAAYPEIREKVREIQRRIAGEGKIILAGRDIGTVVLPDADLKIYLDVSLDIRAERRFHAQIKDNRTLEEVKEDLLLRDLKDTTRDVSPMKMADDAIVICTDEMQPDEVVEAVLKHIPPDSE